MIFIIAWKNIWRNKVRSLIILFAIVIGLFGGLFSSGLISGLITQRVKSAIAIETANIQIHHPQYSLNKELIDTIAGCTRLEQMLDTMKAVEGWTLRLKITGMAGTATTGTGVVIIGTYPEKEKSVTELYTCIPDSNGTWFAEGRKNSIIIGHKLASKLKAKLRSKIVLTFQAADQRLVSAAFKVTGIYHTDNSTFDERMVYVRYDDLSPLLSFPLNRVHEIAVKLHDDAANDQVKTALHNSFPALEILGWKEISPELGMMTGMVMEKLYIIMTIILLALSFGIINTMLMAVLERTREIGMLMAIGMSRLRVFWMIMAETIMLALTGAFTGMCVSTAIIHIYSHVGINLMAFSEGMAGFGFNAIVYPSLEFNFYIVLTILVIILGILSSIIPARKALKLNPVEAIRIL